MATRFILAAAAAFALAACGQQATTTDTDLADDMTQTQPDMAAANMEFAQTAAAAGAFEVQSSQLAASRAQLQTVKDFAQRMITDHTAAGQQLTGVATAAGMTAPSPQLTDQQQAAINNLTSLNGEAFDDAYLDAQVEAHENAVSAFQTYLANAQAGPLRDWAQQTLPTLQQHLADVRALENAT